MKPTPTLNEALEQLRYLCSKSEKCKKDIADKLRSWNFEGDGNKIAEKLQSEGFINEERYALSAVNDKIRFSKWGKAKVRYFLKGKGIEESIIVNALESFEQDYESIVEKELQKKLKSIKEPDNFKKMQKLLSFAFQRGYDSELARKISERLIKQ